MPYIFPVPTEYGGKWKMLHYFAKNFFAPVLVSPRLLSTGDVDVYLLNDRFVPIVNASINVHVFKWNSLTPVCSPVYEGNVPALSSKKQPFRIKLWNQNTDEIFLRFSLQGEGLTSTPYNYIFPKPLKSIEGLREPNIQVKWMFFLANLEHCSENNISCSSLLLDSRDRYCIYAFTYLNEVS